MASHLVVALATSAALMLAMGLCVGLAHGAAIGDVPGATVTMVGAALVRVPAVWAVTGLAAALFGLLPRATVAAWVALVAFLVVGELGPLVRLPGWAMDTSPFAHVPSLPGGADGLGAAGGPAGGGRPAAGGRCGGVPATGRRLTRPRVSACPSPQDLSRALADTPDVQWSVRAVDVATGRELCSHDAAAVLPTASVGKVLLLVETARQVEAGELDPAQPLPRLAEDAVQDSGIWQLLAADRLCVDDLAHLVGIVSDNLATNVLLRRVGLDRVQRTADHLGLRHTRLNDRVRDQRGPGDPWTLSEGSASEWVDLLTRLAADAVVSAAVSRRVLRGCGPAPTSRWSPSRWGSTPWRTPTATGG